MRSTLKRAALGLCLALGCQDSSNEDETGGGTDGVGESSGSEESGSGGFASCDEQPVITYDTFGRGFIAAYCDGCHGSEVSNRQGAPPQVVFDNPAGADMFADRILARAAPADGSAATMPPVGGVTSADTERLVIWLTCFP